MPTIRQLAKMLGVSHSSVSRALSGAPGVSAETRRRVVTLAEELSYRSNRFAQRRSAGKSGLLGFLASSLDSDYLLHILRGAISVAHAEGYQIIPEQSACQRSQALLAIETLLEYRVEGLILANYYDGVFPDSVLLELWSRGIPVVGVKILQMETPIDLVTTDEVALAQLAVDHLFQLGHQRISFFGCTKPTSSLYPRTTAILQALERRKLSTAYLEAVDDGTPESTAKQLQHLLALSAPPTAVITTSENIAVHLLHCAHTRGLCVPEALSIVTCGNSSVFKATWPPLTSIDTHPTESGRVACSLLCQRIATGMVHPDPAPECRLVPPQLIPRASCARPASVT
jgi:DNA-binding LacI/PurR family transcriptional regulator